MSQQYETEEIGNTIDRDGDNDNNEVDSLLLQGCQQYESKRCELYR